MLRFLLLASLMVGCAPDDQPVPPSTPVDTLEAVADTAAAAAVADEPQPLGVDTTIFRTVPVDLEGRMAQAAFGIQGVAWDGAFSYSRIITSYGDTLWAD